MQTRTQPQAAERRCESDDRPELQLDIEILEERIAPSLFAFAGTGTSTGTIDWSRYIDWGEPFHP